MIKILGRKQTSDNAKWLEAIERIEALVSREELDEAVAIVNNLLQSRYH